MKRWLRCLLRGHRYTNRIYPPACSECCKPFYR